MSITAVQDIYDRLHAVTAYHPGTVEVFDDFLQEAGDIVSVISNGEPYALPIFSQHMVWNGSMMTTLESTGNKRRNDLPPLQKKQKTGGYRSGQRITDTEEQLHGYYTDFIHEKTVVGMVAEAFGVALDQDGNPIINEQTGEFEWDDENGATVYSRMVLGPNRAQLISAINNGGTGTMISGSLVDLSAQGAVLIKAINGGGSASSVTISADKVNLDGYVQAPYVDATIATVSQLTVGEGYSVDIYANSANATSGNINDLTVGTLRMTAGQGSDTLIRKAVKQYGTLTNDLVLGTGSSVLEIPDGIATLRLSGPDANGQYTLYKTTHSNSTETAVGSFSRAASTKVSGAWSGSIYTVSADPDGQALPIQISPSVKLSGNGSSANFTAEMVTFEGGSATPTVRGSTPGYLVLAGSGATAAVTVGPNSDGTGSVARCPVGSVYNAGRAAVTLSDTLSWTTTPSSAITASQNAVTVTTTGRTDASGTAAELTKTVNLYSQATTSGLTATFYVTHTNSTDGNRIIKHTATCSDSNLVAGNIKKDIEIFGVTGTYEGSGGSGTGTITAITQHSTAEYNDSTNVYTIHARASGTNLSNANNRFDKDLTLTATAAWNAGKTYGENHSTGGMSGLTNAEQSSEPTADSSWGTLTNGKWYLVTATPNSGTAWTRKFYVPAGGGGGHDTVTGDEIDLNGSSASTSASKPTTALTKANGYIRGYIWFQTSGGSWKNLRSFSISYPRETVAATHITDFSPNATGLYYRVGNNYFALSNNTAYIYP